MERFAKEIVYQYAWNSKIEWLHQLSGEKDQGEYFVILP
jgi:hypothetical protein